MTVDVPPDNTVPDALVLSLNTDSGVDGGRITNSSAYDDEREIGATIEYSTNGVDSWSEFPNPPSLLTGNTRFMHARP